MRLHFIPIHIFRETPSVTFFDAGVQGSNGTDVVCHNGSATSPPDLESSEQYYVHQHQVDHPPAAAYLPVMNRLSEAFSELWYQTSFTDWFEALRDPSAIFAFLVAHFVVPRTPVSQ